MPSLQINGWTVPVAVESLTEEPNESGDRALAFDGGPRAVRSGKKRRWSGESTPLTADTAHALLNLILGEGHYWSFDSDLYSSKGLGPEAGYTVTQPGAYSKYGSGIQIGLGGTIAWDLGYTDAWTVCTWQTLGAAENWAHLAVDSDGNKYEDGSANAGLSTDWLNVAAGVFTLQDTDSSPNYCYDELIILPYVATSSQLAAWYALTSAFSSLPRLSVSGDAIDYGPVTCEGEVPESAFRPFASGGTWQTAGQIVKFSLVEV